MPVMDDEGRNYDSMREADFTRARFDDYLLGTLPSRDMMRIAEAVAIIPGLNDELQYAEEVLIDDFLSKNLDASSHVDFLRTYVNTKDTEKRAKYDLQDRLRSYQVKKFAERPGQKSGESGWHPIRWVREKLDL